MIRFVIVEDDPMIREEIKRLLSLCDDELELIGEADSGSSAVALINTTEPDLVFMDIELPELSGFEILQQCKKRPAVIFVTAHNTFAVQAFEINSIDYVLKPIETERLKQAVERYKKTRKIISDELVELFDELIQAHKSRKTFCVFHRDEVKIIPIQDVYFFTRDENYIRIHTVDDSYLYKYTLDKLENELHKQEFVRINQSTIVAVHKIRKLHRCMFQRYKYFITMSDKNTSQFDISRMYLQSIRKELDF